jgi:hypothetical protein
MTSAMTQVKRQYDDVNSDVGSNAGRMSDGRKLDGRPTKVGRKSNGCPTEVGRTSDKSRTKIQQTSDESRTCRTQPPLRRWRAAALPRNAAAMAGSIAARSVVATLADNALQLAAFLRRCCSNALDVATLLRWPVAHWTSQRYCDGQQRAGPRSVLLRCPAARWALERCCDVRQRYNSGQRCAAVFLFCFFFFLTDNLKREKEWRKKEVLTPAL